MREIRVWDAPRFFQNQLEEASKNKPPTKVELSTRAEYRHLKSKKP